MAMGITSRIGSVSYTHLDVYKRQAYDWVAQQFKDWAFTLTTSILYYNDYDLIDEDTRNQMCIRDRPYRVYGVYGNFEVHSSFLIRRRIDHLNACLLYTSRCV